MSILLHKNARVDLFGNAVIPAGTTVIGRMAFHKCERLRRVQIPGTVERIEERAFAGCENLRSILLDEGVQSIEDLAFSGRDLHEIILPDSVRQVSRAAFNLCEGLTKPVYNRSGTVLYAYPRNAEERIFTVPARVKRINPGAFQDTPHLQEVILPVGLEVLERWTFSGCGLRRLSIPKSVKRVCSCAVWGCRSLEVIEIQGEDTVLEDLIAYRCDGYKLVTRGNYPIDGLFRATAGTFLQKCAASVPEDFRETAEFLALAQRCAEGDPDAMWAMGNHFAGLGAQPFYELASNFWRYRAYQRGSSDAKVWFRHWTEENGGQRMPALMNEMLTGNFDGKLLRAMGFLFFDPNRSYTIERTDADGVAEVSSWSSTEGPDEDGFGMEECYDWWYLSEDLQEQPGVGYIHDFSRLDKNNNRERFQALHDAVADAVRKRRENK